MNKILRNILILIALGILAIILFNFEKRVFVSSEALTDETNLSSIIQLRVPVDILTPRNLARHFPDTYEAVSVILSEPIEVEPVSDTGPVTNHNWKFISTIVQAGEATYYFKNIRNSRLLELKMNSTVDSWKIIAVEEDYFILKEDETLYKVLKK